MKKRKKNATTKTTKENQKKKFVKYKIDFKKNILIDV